MAGTNIKLIAVPDVRSDIGSILAAVTALKTNMNLLMVNSQSNATGPNLTGSNIFVTAASHLGANTALQAQLNQVNSQVQASAKPSGSDANSQNIADLQN